MADYYGIVTTKENFNMSSNETEASGVPSINKVKGVMKHDPILKPNPQDIDWGQEIKSETLKRLGKPKRLYKITACNVFDSNWRVNVWVNREVETEFDVILSPTIPKGHSFFVTVRQGGLLEFNPDVEKLYGT